MVRLFTILRAGDGTLSTMAAPAGHPELPANLSELRRDGVDVLVSMLGPHEEARLGLTGEERYAVQAGLEFLRLPTRDFQAPGAAATLTVASDIATRLANGQHVAIHCRGGVGRSSTLAAAVLLQEGLPSEVAWAAITAARGTQVPETSAQRKLIDGLDGKSDG